MKIYNTLSGKKEEFLPGGEEVKMYVCGVTPYDRCHIGHGMSYVIFDVIRRYLDFRGYKVKYVQNFTDVDDKTIAQANEIGISTQELTSKFIEEYFENMDALNVKRAHIYPKATEEIPDIIKVVQGLIEKGNAYEVKGNVYFRVLSFPTYGKLGHRGLEGMMAGARIEVEEVKEHPLDFALWKAAKPGEPSWESPWGRGRPGWHIECSVMSLKYLGKTLDIHGGGQDLIFPHHENEIAQSESFTGIVPFVRYWLHNGLMQLGEGKMSKSLGNLVSVKEFLEKYSADAFRLLVLSSHYRSPLTYSEEEISAMERAVDRLRRIFEAEDKEAEGQSMDAEPYRQRFIQAMDNDFNTPKAVATFFDLAREINRAREEGIRTNEARKVFRELTNVLGLKLKKRSRELPAEPFIELLITTRAELRAAKQWQLADLIRNRLSELGIKLEDTPQGTRWEYKMW